MSDVRLIDAKKLYQELFIVKDKDGNLRRIPDVDCFNKYIDIHIKDVKRAILKAPIIDAVPVVRCKKCMYWQSGKNECEKWEYCTFHNINIGPYSFCSYGEKMDSEQ